MYPPRSLISGRCQSNETGACLRSPQWPTVTVVGRSTTFNQIPQFFGGIPRYCGGIPRCYGEFPQYFGGIPPNLAGIPFFEGILLYFGGNLVSNGGKSALLWRNFA